MADLKGFVEELERLAEEKAAIAEQEKAVKAAAKERGYSVKVITTILKLRKMSPEERAEYEGLIDLYKAELGMLDGTPLGKAARDRLAKKPDDSADVVEPDVDAAADGGGSTGPSQGEIEAAREEGSSAQRDGKDILDNPYLAADPRRAAWDEGHCMAAGSDGMDVPDAWKPKRPRKPKKGGDDDAA